MHYIPYRNINENDYQKLQLELIEIEKIATPLMERNGFNLTSSILETEGLGLDYITESNNQQMGNISLSFEDFPNKKTFSFIVIKAFDEGRKRKYKKEFIKRELNLDEVEQHTISFYNLALNIYNGWRKEDLTEEIILE